MIESIITSWQAFNIWIALGVLLAYAVVDAMYAYYTVQIIQKDAVRSATTGALMHFLIAVGVLSYVENYLYVIPIALGSWFGTYYTVLHTSKKRL